MKSQNILVVTQWSFEDGLIQAYTLPYLKMIHAVTPAAKIYLITHEKGGLDKNEQKLKEINRQLLPFNVTVIPEKYFNAGIKKYVSAVYNFLTHLYLLVFKNIKFIHAFGTPAGGYAYLLTKLTGRQLVIDSFEPHADYMLECGVWRENSFPYKLLRVLETKQASRANYLIAAANELPSHARRADGVTNRLYVKPACVNLDQFSFKLDDRTRVRTELGLTDKIVCVYTGRFGGFYLETEIFEFFQTAFKFWGQKFHVLLLSDLPYTKLEQHCSNANLNIQDFTLRRVSHDQVSAHLAAADFGLSPYRPTPTKKYCTPIKNGEYWALGLPVVITKGIAGDSDFIEKEKIGYALKDLSGEEFLNAVTAIDDLLKQDDRARREKIRQVAVARRSYKIAEDIYKEIYAPVHANADSEA